MRRRTILTLLILATVAGAQQPHTQASDNSGATALAVVVGLATIVSAACAGLQVRVMVIANRKMERNLELTQQAANAATKSADATEKAVNDSQEASAANLALTRQAAEASTRSAALAEQSLRLFERPWVTFKQPYIQYRNLSGMVPGGLGIGGTTATPVHPHLTNTGRSPAILHVLGVGLYVGTEPPNAEEVLEELSDCPSSGIIMPGQDYIWRPVSMEVTTGQKENVFFVAVAEYSDVLGNRHRSSCIWHFDEIPFDFKILPVPEFLQ